MIEIAEERPGDVAVIRDLNRLAFGQDQEGNIVDALRSNGGALLSLVATLNDQVAGHIMYSPIAIGSVTGAALGPMAVLPEHQREGIGSKLVEAGNRKLQDGGCPFIVVVGHPQFYPRCRIRRPIAHQGQAPARPAVAWLVVGIAAATALSALLLRRNVARMPMDAP